MNPANTTFHDHLLRTYPNEPEVAANYKALAGQPGYRKRPKSPPLPWRIAPRTSKRRDRKRNNTVIPQRGQ